MQATIKITNQKMKEHMKTLRNLIRHSDKRGSNWLQLCIYHLICLLMECSKIFDLLSVFIYNVVNMKRSSYFSTKLLHIYMCK